MGRWGRDAWRCNVHGCDGDDVTRGGVTTVVDRIGPDVAASALTVPAPAPDAPAPELTRGGLSGGPRHARPDLTPRRPPLDRDGAALPGRPTPRHVHRRRRRWPRWAAPTAVGAAPLVALVVSLVVGGGPGTATADDALLTLAARDAARGHLVLGPYSRFGWHHPGPSYLYWLSVPTHLWGGTPTGTWIGATALAAVAAAGTVLLVARRAGPVAGWWAAAGVLVVIAGLTPGALRDPWNPYAVALPLLFVLVASALGAAGLRGTLRWAAVAGSLVVQTHISTVPVVVGALGLATGARAVRWSGQRWLAPAAPTARASAPGGSPASVGRAGDGGTDRTPVSVRSRALGRRPHRWGLVAVVVVVMLEWLPTLWDQVAGSGNLSAIWTFFSTSHPGHSLGESWRLVAAMLAVVVTQHHSGVHEGAADPNAALIIAVYAGTVAVAMLTGLRGRRPVAVWMGVFGAVALALAVMSTTRIVGAPYRYLLVWVTPLPAVPLIGAGIGVAGLLSRGDRGVADDQEDRLAGRRSARWWRAAVRGADRPVTALVTMAVVGALALAAVGVGRAEPAVALTDHDVASVWQMVSPVVDGAGRPSAGRVVHEPVRVEIADGERWPTAAGLVLELERHGYPARVEDRWALLFGRERRAAGDERVVIVVAGADRALWPSPQAAALRGAAGRAHIFLRR